MSSLQPESAVNIPGIWHDYSDFSPDGRMYAGEEPGSSRAVCVWDLSSGKPLLNLVGHSERLTSVGFSRDGQRIISSSEDRTARVWDIQKQVEVAKFVHEQSIVCAALSSDGLTAATSCDKGIYLWNVKDGRELMRLPSPSPSYYLTFSPDGKMLGFYLHSDSVRLIDVAQQREVLSLESTRSDWVRAIEFSPDSTRIAAVSDYHPARIYDAHSGRELAALHGHASWVFDVAWSLDGKKLATASYDKTVRVWSQRRPEYAWGIIALPEFWLTLILLSTLALRIWKRPRVSKTAHASQ